MKHTSLLACLALAACAGTHHQPAPANTTPAPPPAVADDGQPWWNQQPWLDIDSQWDAHATWTSPRGDTLQLDVQDHLDEHSTALVAHGAAGETVLLETEPANAATGAVAALSDGTVAFRVDEYFDDHATSTLYLLRWNDDSQVLAIADVRTDALEGD